jgi:hypothetical protein
MIGFPNARYQNHGILPITKPEAPRKEEEDKKWAPIEGEKLSGLAICLKGNAYINHC